MQFFPQFLTYLSLIFTFTVSHTRGVRVLCILQDISSTSCPGVYLCRCDARVRRIKTELSGKYSVFITKNNCLNRSWSNIVKVGREKVHNVYSGRWMPKEKKVEQPTQMEVRKWNNIWTFISTATAQNTRLQGSQTISFDITFPQTAIKAAENNSVDSSRHLYNCFLNITGLGINLFGEASGAATSCTPFPVSLSRLAIMNLLGIKSHSLHGLHYMQILQQENEGLWRYSDHYGHYFITADIITTCLDSWRLKIFTNVFP